ncbi:hypothetical protein ACWDOR_04825 [Streptosporangium canum]
MSAVILFAVACTPEDSAISTSTPVNAGAVVDSGPYICKLVPEKAFLLVSGTNGPPGEKISGDEANGNCWTSNIAPKLLEVVWMQETPESTRGYLDEVMEDRRRVFTRHGAAVLPSDLGEGFAVYFPEGPFSDQPYQVTARFSCGGKGRIIDLNVAQVAKGRDGIRDMIELMRIAQKRYGQLYKCTPGE